VSAKEKAAAHIGEHQQAQIAKLQTCAVSYALRAAAHASGTIHGVATVAEVSNSSPHSNTSRTHAGDNQLCSGSRSFVPLQRTMTARVPPQRRGVMEADAACAS
jgi:hypothetical protein